MVAYLRHRLGEAHRLARCGPKKEDHATVGQECPACFKTFVAGDYTTLIPLGPADSEENGWKANQEQWFNAVAIEIHYSCAIGRPTSSDVARTAVPSDATPTEGVEVLWCPEAQELNLSGCHAPKNNVYFIRALDYDKREFANFEEVWSFVVIASSESQARQMISGKCAVECGRAGCDPSMPKTEDRPCVWNDPEATVCDVLANDAAGDARIVIREFHPG